MAEKVHENAASPDSYVVIRIKLPTIKTLVGRVTSKKTSFGKRVGSMLNNVIGKKSYMDETETESDESELAEGMKKVMVDTNGEQNLNDGMVEKERVDTNGEQNLNDGMAEKERVDTNGEQNLNDGMAEKERPFKSPRRTAELEEISKRIDMLLEKMKVHDDAGSKGVEFETATRCVTFRSFWSMRTMGGENQIELCKKKILMGMRCRPLSDDENGLLIP